MRKKLLITGLLGLISAIICYFIWKDVVTAIFLGIIIGTFCYFAQEIILLWSAYNKLKSQKDSDILESLSDSKLHELVESYKKTINIDINKTKKTNDPSAEFFNIQSVANAYHVNLKSLDSASGMLVGLGLIGTFFGLTIGISNFDSSNSENIQNSIQTLLNGMGIAFLTSLFGMAFSLVNTGFDKHWRNNLQKKVKEITDALDNQYYIDDMALMEYRQQRMYEFADEDGNRISINSAIGHILEECKTQSSALSSFNTDLSTMLNNSLGEQIDVKLAPVMNRIVEHIDQMADTIVKPSNDMMEKVSSELKESMALIVNEFKNKVSDTATQQLESISLSLSSATKAIDLLPDNVTNAINSMQDAVANVQKSMITLTEDIMSRQADLLALQESTTLESNNLIENLKTGLDRLEEVNNNYVNTISAFKKAQENIEKSLSSLSIISNDMQRVVLNFQESQAEYGENMKLLQTQSQGSIDSASQLITHAGELSSEYASQFSVIREGLKGIFEKLKEGLEEYSKTMQQTTQEYLQQYSKSLTETADSLKTSIDMMGDNISELSEIVEKSKK